MINCKDCLNQISNYLDSELDADLKRSLEELQHRTSGNDIAALGT